ncbi:MAG: P1 family peptidase [Bacillota bacterium]
MYGNITDVAGVKVGNASDPEGLTGCTVVLVEEGAVAGADVRGSAPGTRETDLLRPVNLVERVHAVVLAGGSAFGLDAACGVMEWLEERGVGFDTGVARVPIVPAAVLFDLDLGNPRARPDRHMGILACQQAAAGSFPEGNVGAGTGCTVGKVFGTRWATRGGLGSCSIRLGDGLTVGALVAVNSFGDVLDWRTGRLLAGARNPMTGELLDTARHLREAVTGDISAWPVPPRSGGPAAWSGGSGGRADGSAEPRVVGAGCNTTLAVVATDAHLTKEEVNKLAQMAQDGLARAISPAHTMFDGDVVFALATGKRQANVTLVGALAAEAVAEAIRRAVLAATGAGGIPACRDLTGN